MKCAVNFCCFFLIIASCEGITRSRSRSNYGEFCDNRSVRCDSTLSLSCKDEKCVCMKPESMIYDSGRGSCTALAGEKCKFTVLEEYRSWHEEVLCVSNAHCDSTRNVCICNRDFLELSNGTCIPKKNYNESCETSLDCKRDGSLICSNSKKCVCNPDISEYSDEMETCVGLVGRPCVNDLCTTNAICREEGYYGGYSPEIDSSEEYPEAIRDPASAGRCQCRTAFGVTADGRCQLGYGGKCDYQHATCMNWLKCKEGTCICKFPSHQVYDKTAERCVSKILGPCTASEPEETGNGTETSSSSSSAKLECISGAICSKRPNSLRYQCLCPHGFIENSDRTCDLDYGQQCKILQASVYSSSSRHSHSHPETLSSMKCDKIGKLSCIDGRCQCDDDWHMYDRTSRSCKGLVGATCPMKDKSYCVTGAFCQLRRGSPLELQGTCQCQQQFYKENDDGTCSPKLPQTISLKSGGGGGINEDIGDAWNSSSNIIQVDYL